MTQWTYADIWQSIAHAQPQAPAFVQGGRIVSWQEFDLDASALAQYFLDHGLGHQAKVAAYLYNCPEYLVTVNAAFKAGMAPFNVNYRYGGEELLYLLGNADAEAVVFDSAFYDTLVPIRSQLPRVKCWIAAGRRAADSHDLASGSTVDWAIPYEQAVQRLPRAPVSAAWGRSGDDLVILYTGGTTGMPKGVMWRQEDLLGMARRANPVLSLPGIVTIDDIVARVLSLPRRVSLIASPLMHATGQIAAMSALSGGAAVAFLPSRKFDAVQLWNEVARLRASRITVVGAAFCVPMLEALEAQPGRWDLSCVEFISSSGAMWSYENKHGLLKHLPRASLSDSFSSSEAFGMGTAISTRSGEVQTAKFALGPDCALFTEDGRRLQPGSQERGLLAVSGYIPLGYYGDPEKTARTFPVIEGKRWSMPGDWATVNADGTLNVLGRGSQCISTAGEKVFPEEVEEMLKRHRSIRDAAVVGVPDQRFGEKVCAIVELQPAAAAVSLDELQAFVKQHLAGYKAPRALVLVSELGRAPNGKLDYRSMAKLARERMATAHASTEA